MSKPTGVRRTRGRDVDSGVLGIGPGYVSYGPPLPTTLRSEQGRFEEFF
jgi:hypothetical protein